MYIVLIQFIALGCSKSHVDPAEVPQTTLVEESRGNPIEESQANSSEDFPVVSFEIQAVEIVEVDHKVSVIVTIPILLDRPASGVELISLANESSE